MDVVIQWLIMVIRLISKTREVGSVAKLFAKHKKVSYQWRAVLMYVSHFLSLSQFEDQKKLLQQSVTPVAVATPDRLSRLLNESESPHPLKRDN